MTATTLPSVRVHERELREADTGRLLAWFPVAAEADAVARLVNESIDGGSTCDGCNMPGGDCCCGDVFGQCNTGSQS